MRKSIIITILLAALTLTSVSACDDGAASIHEENMRRIALSEAEDISAIYDLREFFIYYAGTMQARVVFTPTDYTQVALTRLNNALYNSPIDLDELTTEFNEENGTDFQLSSPVNVYDIHDNYLLFSFLNLELLDRSYILQEMDNRTEEKRELSRRQWEEWRSQELRRWLRLREEWRQERE
jgi:hypothetical protein